MADSNKKRYPKLYREEFELARTTLSQRAGALEWSRADYEAFTYVEPGVRLVFYPHRTSAGNYHIRIRDGNSKDAALADRLMRELDKAAGYNRTFSRKT